MKRIDYVNYYLSEFEIQLSVYVKLLLHIRLGYYLFSCKLFTRGSICFIQTHYLYKIQSMKLNVIHSNIMK